MSLPLSGDESRYRFFVAIAAGLCLTLGAGTFTEAGADDWQVESGDDRQAQIIERYRTMLEDNPASQMALDRLIGHVGRGAGLSGLIDDYRRRVDDSPEAVNLRLVLGHLLEARGDYDQAFEQYDRAVQLEPDEAGGWLGRGTVRLLRGDRAEAMEDFEEALDREDDAQRRREIMEELGELAFSQREFDRGMEFFERLIGENPRDQYLRMAYVQLLVQYRQVDEAIEQYEQLRPLVSGDPRREANLLRDKADVYEMMGQPEEALEVYQEVMELVRSDSWIAREVRHRIVDVYRQAGRLDDFLDTYGTSWRSGDIEQQTTVADVYGELGRLEEALDEYERLMRRRPSAVEPREKAIRVLERLGRESEIPDAYRQLIGVAPENESYRFELAGYLIETGDREAATEVLDEVERRFSNRSYVLLTLADHYARWQYRDRARRTYDTVLERETDDDAVLIDVGDFYFERGEQSRAVEIWSKLPDSQLGDREGRRRQAQVLVERGIIEEGVEVYDELLEETPDDQRLLRSMARALERSDRLEEALERWTALLEISDSPRHRREARSRIVQLHERMQALPAKIRQWEARFDEGADAQAIEAGFFLAEGHLRRRDYGRAEVVLDEIRSTEGLSDDQRVGVLEILEQVYVRSGRYDDAVEVLEQLAVLRPDDRPEFLNRQAEHALAGGDEEGAVEYRSILLEANPDDARAHRRLADTYREIGDLEAAASHYRTAVDIDPGADDIQLSRGEVLIRLGEIAEAEEALMEVVADSSDDQLVRDAGELMLEMATEYDRLDSLETRWIPLTFRMPVRRAHAELMFDLYDRLAGPLMMEAYHGSTQQRRAASDKLHELGGRATTLVAGQLRADDVAAQSRALRMVAEMEVDVASAQVARLIEGSDDERLRHMAIVAAARLGTEDAVGQLVAALDDGSAKTRYLAVWALGFIDSEEARQTLWELAGSEVSGTAQRLALLGLATTEQTDSQRAVLIDRLDEVAEYQRQIGTDEAVLWLMVAAAQIEDAGGEQFFDSLKRLVENRDDDVGLRAATVLGRLSDVEVAETLWRLTLSDNRQRAKRGEFGLIQMLAGPSSMQREWSREVRFFDWADGEFEASELVEDRIRSWMFDTGSYDGPVWNDVVEAGLVSVLSGDEEEAFFREVPVRITEQLTGLQTPVLWERERASKIAEIVIDERGEHLSEEVSGYLTILRDDVDAWFSGRQQEWGRQDLMTLLGGLAVSSGQLQTSERLEALIIEALSDSDVDVRRQALVGLVEGLGPDAPGEAVRDAIVIALGDQRQTVQLAALRAVGHFGIQGVDDRLDDIEQDGRPAIRRAVRQTRRQLNDQFTGDP